MSTSLTDLAQTLEASEAERREAGRSAFIEAIWADADDTEALLQIVRDHGLDLRTAEKLRGQSSQAMEFLDKVEALPEAEAAVREAEVDLKAAHEKTGTLDEVQEAVKTIHVEDLIKKYIVDLVGMTREQLLEFAKRYEKIFRPRRDADNDSDEDDQSIPEEPSPEADAKTDVVLGSGVDDKAKELGRVDDEELSEERLKDLFDEFSDNISPEYRDVIEAYYKRLAGDESDSK